MLCVETPKDYKAKYLPVLQQHWCYVWCVEVLGVSFVWAVLIFIVFTHPAKAKPEIIKSKANYSPSI